MNDVVPPGVMLEVELCADEELAAGWLPDSDFVQRHAMRAISAHPEFLTAGDLDAPGYALSVRLVAEPAGRELNRTWRGIDRPTNVLSFQAGMPALDGMLTLGDLVFCPSVVAREAGEQGKELRAHWAHLIIHGTLHLLGLDHVEASAADRMEALEIQLLSAAGIANPYRGTAADPDE